MKKYENPFPPSGEENKELLEDNLEPVVLDFQNDFDEKVSEMVNDHEKELKKFF